MGCPLQGLFGDQQFVGARGLSVGVADHHRDQCVADFAGFDDIGASYHKRLGVDLLLAQPVAQSRTIGEAFRQPTEMTVRVGEAQHQVLGAHHGGSFLAVRPGAPTVLRDADQGCAHAGLTARR